MTEKESKIVFKEPSQEDLSRITELINYPATVSSNTIFEALEKHGCVVIDRLVDNETMDSIGKELASSWQEVDYGPDDGFDGKNTLRMGGLVSKSEKVLNLVGHNRIMDLLSMVFGSDPSYFQLSCTSAIDIKPGQKPQDIHRDQWGYGFFSFPDGFVAQCNTIWAMTDFTEENGATRIVPGSHKWKDRLKVSIKDTVPATMKKGSVLIYYGSVYHGGGENVSQGNRIGLNFDYSRSWLRQEENQYLSCPPSIARNLPSDLAALIGYQKAYNMIGYYNNTNDPAEALEE